MTQRIMHPRKTITLCALVLLLVQTTGCHSFRALQSELPGTRAQGWEARQTVQVTKNDGEKVKLRQAWMDSLSIGGLRGGEPAVDLEIPLTEVTAIEEERLSIIRTGLLGYGILALVGAIVFASTFDPMSGGGIV